MKNKLFASIPSIVFGVLVAVAPQTFAYVCKVGGDAHGVPLDGTG